MRVFVLSVLFLLNLFASDDKLFECNKIFQERKDELLLELDRIDEQKQSLQALKSATEELLKRKKRDLDLREEEVNKKLKEIKQREENIKNMLAENKRVLKELKSTKMSKLAQTYSKMKAASAAQILSNLDEKEAVSILNELKPKTVGQILSKMDPKKASKLTELLVK